MEIFKRLSKKGYKHYYQNTVEELDSMNKDNQHLHSEIMQVIMWLYEKYGIWISVDWTPQNNGDEYPCSVYWYYFISGEVGNPYKTIDDCETSRFNSLSEAYSAAIEYVLINLI